MIDRLIENLSSFVQEERKKAVLETSALVKSGKIKRYEKLFPYDNMHIHSFHSFNYKNWSPSRIIFEAYRTGLKHVGIVDFDTLEALEETIFSASVYKIPSLCGLETRVFIPEYSAKVINSPGEPGIFYINGTGFKNKPEKGTKAAEVYERLGKIAENRNRKVVEKLNAFLHPLTINYEKDVLPLTPSKNPTERHIIKAYIEAAEKTMGNRAIIFWSDILKMASEEVEKMKKEKPGDFMEKIRSALVKNSGPGYVKPDTQNFPTIDEFIKMVNESKGIVVGNWLDGTNEGEKNPEEFLEFMVSRGIKIFTIIPERNWNISNPQEKAIKVNNLEKFMAACKKMNIPVVCGTEMNKFGQPFVDNYASPELKKYLDWFEKSVEYLFEVASS